ncbi:ABC transporter substrate-binding protein [Streptomyces sp. NPDC005438]|uniref:ABC transporter substrate-binding protein n=1 Tax=Streptomyces sp. NPDC005438 TaxID=3156880 RepID=UPI0033AF8861
MKRTRTLSVLLLTVLGLTGVTACGSDGASRAGEGGSDSVEFSIASAVLGPKEEVATYAVGKEEGFLNDARLKVSTSNADGSVAALQAVASGSADITAADLGAVMAAREKGVPVKAVGGLVQNWPWRMAVPPGSDIKKAKDLKGSKIGVISLASGSAMYARAYARNAGLDPERDVELLPVGVGAQAAAALKDKKVDALALYTQAYTSIENTGTDFRYLKNPDMFEGIRSITFAVREDTIAKKRDVLTRYLRASYQSMLFSAVNPEAAMRDGYGAFPQILAGKKAADRLSDDTKVFQAWMDTATPTSGKPAEFGDWGAISDREWTKTVAYTKESGQIKKDVKRADAWDGSLLKKANDFDAKDVVAQARKAAK